MSIPQLEAVLQNDLRAPQAKVTLNGVILPGVLSAEIESTSHFAADRFRARFAASLVPQELLHIPGVELEIEIGVGSQWLSCIVGTIDSVSFDPIQAVVNVEGRDLSSQFIETQTDETFANRTASELAILLGSRHGLSVLADPTTTPIGRYYQSEHDRASLGQFAKTTTEWDLLAGLASREGFDLFMAGRVLRFGLPTLTGGKQIRVSDCISLQLGHCVGLTRPIDVVIKSWNSKTSMVVTGHALSFGIGPAWQRRITRPNLTSGDAQLQAQRVVDDLKRHEWTASLTMPGELSITARSIIILQGTNTQSDRMYTVSQVSRRLDLKHGFTQSLSLQGIL